MSAGAPYAPFMEPRTARPPGLSPLDPDAWIAHDADYAPQMAERDRLLAAWPTETMAAQPEAAAPLAELRAALLAHLAGRDGWRVGAEHVTRPDAAAVPLTLDTLTLAGRLCQEDLLLMTPPETEGGEYRLVAGVLCFPARWTLIEKLGRPLTRIHDPVPGYVESLATRVNRVFEALRPERPLMRANWLVHATDRLDLPMRERDKIAPPDAARGFFLRTERQTLLRLPETRAVVFGVKTSVTPLADLTPGQRSALRSALASYDADDIGYHGGEAAWRAALTALDAASQPSP